MQVDSRGSHPRFFVAFSLPLQKDNYEGLLDVIEREGDDVRKAGPGYYRIRSKELTCELVAPASATPRLVCGFTSAAFRELGPWMYTSLATQAKAPGDISVRLEFAPFREELLPILKRELDDGLGGARKGLSQIGVNDPELLDAPSNAAKELLLFLEELDRVELGATLDAGKPAASMKGELFFKGNQSWATKAMTSGLGPAGPAPEVFWRLPKDADTAVFGRNADPALFTTIRRIAKKAAGVGLQFARLDKADNDAILGLFDALPTTKGTFAFASGPLAPLPGAAPAGDKPDAFKPEHAVVEMKNRVRSLARWNVFSEEGDPAAMAAFLKQAADVYARGTKFLKKKADEDVKNASGDMKKWAQEDRKKLDTRLPKVKFTANPPGLPKGSAALDMDIAFTSKDVWTVVHPITGFDARPKHPDKEAKGNVVLRLLVVPDEGGRYFWGLSADGEALKEKILAASKSGKPEAQLSTRTDLARMKGSLQSGGFASLGTVVHGIAELGKNDRDMRQLLELMDAAPNKFAAPIFIVAGGKAGSTPSLSVEITLEKAWLEDIAFAVGQMMRGSSKPPPRKGP